MLLQTALASDPVLMTMHNDMHMQMPDEQKMSIISYEVKF